MVNPDGLSKAELAAIRGLQRRVTAPLVDDPVWERLGESGLMFVKLCETPPAEGLPPVRRRELTSRGHAYRTD